MSDLAIFYEHPQWFQPLFATLERRGVRYSAHTLQDHRFDPADRDLPAPVVFNRLAMSSYLRQREHATFYTLSLMAHLEHCGARVVNGTAALALDTSKARQLSLFRALGLIYRCETLGGRFLYAIALDGAGSTFDLCPADVCQAERERADKPSISISRFDPPAEIIAQAEAVAQAAHLDVGGIEYMVDDRDGTPRFYDLNALSNFVANPLEVLGYDPHERLVDWLEREIAGARREAA